MGFLSAAHRLDDDTIVKAGELLQPVQKRPIPSGTLRNAAAFLRTVQQPENIRQQWPVAIGEHFHLLQIIPTHAFDHPIRTVAGNFRFAQVNHETALQSI